MNEITFVVEQAGCASCAERVRSALAPIAHVRSVEVDETDDSAAVRLAAAGELAEADVNRVLADASADAGHRYVVRRGSWRTLR